MIYKVTTRTEMGFGTKRIYGVGRILDTEKLTDVQASDLEQMIALGTVEEADKAPKPTKDKPKDAS